MADKPREVPRPPSHELALAEVLECLDRMEGHGVRFRRAPNEGGWDAALVAGKPLMLEALRMRELRGSGAS